MKREDIEAFVRGAITAYDEDMGKVDPMPAVVKVIADMWEHDVQENRDEAHQEGVWAGQEAAG